MIKAALTFLLALGGSASAHTGAHHDSLFATLLHLVSEPDHAAALIAAVTAGGVGAVLMRRRAQAARRRMFDER
jgi:hydrogenase/urease accessory protein HupE